MNLTPTKPHGHRSRDTAGFLQVDLAIALIILILAIVPLGYSFGLERQALRAQYARAAAGEIVDGELEILAAGAAKSLPDGTENYIVHARAAAVLPPGHFELTKSGNHLRLAWMPDEKKGAGTVMRETTLK